MAEKETQDRYNERSDPSPGEKVITCKRYAQVEDLSCHMAELQETVKRLQNIRP